MDRVSYTVFTQFNFDYCTEMLFERYTVTTTMLAFLKERRVQLEYHNFLLCRTLQPRREGKEEKVVLYHFTFFLFYTEF
jgi:hypothetical protein